MDSLLSDGSIGGGSMGHRASEKMMESQIGKDTPCPSLSMRTRIYAFGICLCFGILLDLLASGALKSAEDGHFLKFTIPYTLGTILCISGSFFLMGPKRQFKKAFAPERRITSIILVLSILACLIVGFFTTSFALLLVLVIIQLCAYVWYSIIMFPCGKKICCGCCKKAMKMADEA